MCIACVQANMASPVCQRLSMRGLTAGLSTEYMIDCDTSDSGCSGGTLKKTSTKKHG